VREISPQADPVTRTFAVRIALLDADPAVRLGMTASVIQSGAVSNILQVPAPSIVQQNGKPAVWVLGEGGSISLRPVEVAAFREDGVILSGGVKPGEKIVAAGGHKLIPGERVRILETR
jgi:multidrug efflux pump subunit AcrA (membrane-fusion protein)